MKTPGYIHIAINLPSQFKLILHDYLPQGVPQQDEASTQGRVVRKPVNANPGLKVNRGNSFSFLSVIHRLYFVWFENSSLKIYKNEIKILANPGLA